MILKNLIELLMLNMDYVCYYLFYVLLCIEYIIGEYVR